MNNYDLEHVCTGHATMTKAAWDQVYRDALGALLYGRTRGNRAAPRLCQWAEVAPEADRRSDAFFRLGALGGVHPLQFGLLRRKVRVQRRRGMPIVNPLVSFISCAGSRLPQYPSAWLRHVWRYRRLQARIMKDPANKLYFDEALQSAESVNSPPAELVKVFAKKIPKTHGRPANFWKFEAARRKICTQINARTAGSATMTAGVP